MKLINPLSSVLERVQRRFRVTRPGSILILVVALLVLMALIGTAYISTTRIDRYTIRQNAFAQQLDIAADSVVDMTINSISNDLYNGSDYRGPTLDPQNPSTYDNWDGVSVPLASMNTKTMASNTSPPSQGFAPEADANDAWLMPRFPRTMREATQNDKLSVTNPPIWDGVSYPPYQNAPRKTNNVLKNSEYPWVFECPDISDQASPIYLSLRKLWFEPTYKLVNGVWYPALRMRVPSGSFQGEPVDYSGSKNTANPTVFLAADADGDGIADAGLFRLPIGEVNGIRYYAAVRVIDNNSAINVNTAFAHGDFNYLGERTSMDPIPVNSTSNDRINKWLNPSDIDLGTLLRTYDPFNIVGGVTSSNLIPQGKEMNALNHYRWDLTTWPVPSGIESYRDTIGQSFVYDDDKNIRNDYRFNSVGDAMSQQLARRLDNPGWDYDNLKVAPPNTKLFQAFGLEDQAALMYHFVMIQPILNRSPLEDLFYQSVLKPANATPVLDSIYSSAPNFKNRSRSYPSGNPVAANNSMFQWYKDNFLFEDEDPRLALNIPFKENKSYHPRRSMLVAYNAVSNGAPRREMTAFYNVDTATGPNWEVEGPTSITTNMIVNLAPGFGTYNGTPLSPSTEVMWEEQMPYWSKSLGKPNAIPAQPAVSEVIAPKADANTAHFGELWRAFWSVMAEGDGVATAFDRGIESAVKVAQGTFSQTAGIWGAHSNPGLPGDSYTLNDPYIGQKFWGQWTVTAGPAVGAAYPAPFHAEGDTYAVPTETPPNFDPSVAFRLTPQDPFAVNPKGWHPARMFRSSIRAVPYGESSSGGAAAPTAPVTKVNAVQVAVAAPDGPFDYNTPRFPALQEMLLRAALAAVNTEDLRDADFDADIRDPKLLKDSADPKSGPIVNNSAGKPLYGHGTGDITARRIVLKTVLLDPTVPGGATNAIPLRTNVVVYGNERQPFITEVFASTDPTSTNENPYGYVAIELFNPYDDDIEMNNWKIVAIDRRHDMDRMRKYGLQLDQFPFPAVAEPSTPQLIVDFDLTRQSVTPQFYPQQDEAGNPAPLIVPAHGYLLLENFPDALLVPTGAPTSASGVAQKRPLATGLPPGGITSANLGTARSRKDDGSSNKNPTRITQNLPQLNVAYVPGLSGHSDPVWKTPPVTAPGLDPTESWSGIRSVLNREMVLVRPRRADGTYSTGFYPPLFDATGKKSVDPLRFDETTYLSDFVPIDSFDFTGLQLPTVPAGPAVDALHTSGVLATYWHYSRQNADASPSNTPAASTFEPGMWKFVYPGRYDASPATGKFNVIGTTPTGDYPGDPASAIIWGAHLLRSRHQGVETPNALIDASVPHADTAWAGPSPVTLGGTTANGDNRNWTASYPTRFPIQLHADGWQANPLVPNAFNVSASPNTHTADPSIAHAPFGGIARNGDLMQIPFIGAYRVSWMNTGAAAFFSYNTPSGPTVSAERPPGDTAYNDATLPNNGSPLIELNSITMDSVFAEDTDLDDDPRFQQLNTSGGQLTDFVGNIDPAFMNDKTKGEKWRPDTGVTQGREQVGRFCPLVALIREGDERYKGQAPNNGIAPKVSLPESDYVDYIGGWLSRGTGNAFFAYANASRPLPFINQDTLINDYGFDPSFRPISGALTQVGADWMPYWRYPFAPKLFSHLTVQAPHSDAMADYPAQPWWRDHYDYTVGQVVQAIDRFAKTNGKPNPYYLQATRYVCIKAHPSGVAFVPDTDLWYPLVRYPVSNGGSIPGNANDPNKFSAEYPQGVEGLININTADWKVLSTLPLVVMPRTGLNVDPYNPTSPDRDVTIERMKNIKSKKSGLPITYRQLNEELAKAIVYFRDQDGQANPVGYPPNNSLFLVPHGPFKSIFELNQVYDLRPSTDWFVQNSTTPNPFYGHGFADGLGSLNADSADLVAQAKVPGSNINPSVTMPYNDQAQLNILPRNSTSPPPADLKQQEVFDPDATMGDFSPMPDLRTSAPVRKYDGVRGDFEEQFLQVNRISNLITTRSDSFTCYILVQGWRNSGTPNPELVVQKRVAYIIDRSMAPYQPVKKTLVPND